MKVRCIPMLSMLMAVVVLVGCHFHEETLQSPVVVAQFELDKVVIRQNEQLTPIKLVLSSPAAFDGQISVIVAGSDLSLLSFEPALIDRQIVIPIKKGESSGTINIMAAVNDKIGQALDYTLSVSRTSSGLHPGKRKDLQLKLLSDDDESGKSTSAEFTWTSTKLSETLVQGRIILVKLSRSLTSPGTIGLSIQSDRAVYGTHFVTEPTMINGIIELAPSTGSEAASLKLIPLNNDRITNELKITLRIISTSGAIEMGKQLVHDIIIEDDELAGKPKGYSTSNGFWKLSKGFEFDEAGRLKFVHEEKSTPATSTRTDVYEYDAGGRIQRINQYPEVDIVFSWNNGIIARSSLVDHGTIKNYTEYDYDQQGNVSGAASWSLQPDGRYQLNFLTTYFYYNDGNLHQSQTFLPRSIDSTQLVLHSTKTYGGYTGDENLFPIVEILPNIKTQRNLPTIYTIEEHGQKIEFRFTYEFNTDGQLTKRVVTSDSATETSTYEYY